MKTRNHKCMIGELYTYILLHCSTKFHICSFFIFCTKIRAAKFVISIVHFPHFSRWKYFNFRDCVFPLSLKEFLYCIGQEITTGCFDLRKRKIKTQATPFYLHCRFISSAIGCIEILFCPF